VNSPAGIWPLHSLIHLVGLAIEALIWLIVIDAILSWLPQIDRGNPLVRALRTITEPICTPIRRLIPPSKTGYIDVSPLIAIIGLQLLRALVFAIF